MPLPSRALRQLLPLLALAVAFALFLAPAASAQTWDPDDGDPEQQLEQTQEMLRQHRAALAKARADKDGSAIGGLERKIRAEEGYERKLLQKLGKLPPDPLPTTLAPRPDSTDVPPVDSALDIFWAEVARDWARLQEQLGIAGAKERREAAERRLRELKGEPEPAPTNEPAPEPDEVADGQSGDSGQDGEAEGGQQGNTADDGGETTPEQSLETVIIGDGLGDDGDTDEPVVIGGTAPKAGTPARRPDDQEPTDDDASSKMTIEEPGLMGGGPAGDGPCTLPAELEVFCPVGQDKQPPDILVTDPGGGMPDILINVPGKEQTGPRITTRPERVQPGDSGHCPALDGILAMCDPGQGGGSGTRLQTGTVTLAPDTEGDLKDLLEPNTNPNATTLLPVVPAAPGLLLPAALTAKTKSHQADDGHGGDQPSLFASIDPVITVANTSDTPAAGAVTGAVAGTAETGAEQAAEGAGSGLGTGAGGTVTPTIPAPVTGPAEPGGAPVGDFAGEVPPACDPGVPC